MIFQERLNLGWCKIIGEILSKEKDFKYMVKRIQMNRNEIGDEGFEVILRGIMS